MPIFSHVYVSNKFISFIIYYLNKSCFLLQWHSCGRKLFLLYRILFFLYWLTIFVIDLTFNEDGPLFLTYLSRWGQILLLIYLGLSLALLVTKQVCPTKNVGLEMEETELAKTSICGEITETRETEDNTYNKQGRILWSAYTATYFYYKKCFTGKSFEVLCQVTLVTMIISFDFAIIITILYPLLQDPTYNSSIRSINLHIINTVIVIFDICINAIPVRFIHVFFAMTASACYGIMLLLLHAANVTSSVYLCLNWKTKPLKTGIITAVMIFIAPPLAHSILYGIYKLKLLCFKCFTKKMIT